MGASRNAAAVVIDIKTGELLSLVSLPQYDNNIFTGDVDEASWAKIRDDPGKPLVNHAIAEMYPPGSTFKIITGLAALQEGVASASTTVHSPGVIYVTNQYDPTIKYPFKDWAPLGTLNFYRGVAMSSDVYFYYLAGGAPDGGPNSFQGLGAARLADWTRRFGLGAETGIDIPGESEGLVPDPKWKEENVGGPWTLGDTYHFGIGQGYVAATPLQIALVTAAVANGGNLLTPRVLKEVRDSSGQLLPVNQQSVRRNLNIDRRNLDVMREGMRQVVDSGTAQTAKSRFTAVAGKTGTAEFGPMRANGTYQEHGWFTGYAPFNEPQIAVAVFLEQGNGAGTAAPAAAKIFDYYFGERTLTQGTAR
jgi:penicillin-binding protein 2